MAKAKGKLMICPKANKCKEEFCMGKKPHEKTSDCLVNGIKCPKCVEVANETTKG